MIAGAGLSAHAQSTTESDQIAQLQKQNQALQQQLDTLEDVAKKQGLLPSGSDPAVSAMSDMTISGFVQASYFCNVDSPASSKNAGYLWNTQNNNFDINKVKITFASPPAERSGDKWDAGYRVSLMAGQDAPILNSGSGITGFDYLREAYVDLNVPIGTGLNIKAGELISLLNYESGDGGAANENFSQGYQWYYTGNGPAAGVQLDYALTDWLDVKFRVENGLYAGPVATTSGKGLMGSIDLKPNDKLWINLTGFGGEAGGPEDADGGEVLAGYQVTDKLGTGFEGDYFHLSVNNGPSGDLWSVGTWIWYDFTPKVGLAFRAEYLGDPDGVGINVADPNSLAPAPNGAGISSPDDHGNLASFTLTLNLKPTPDIKIQPEIRYNTTSYAGGFNGKDYQVILGCGASYLF
ncbi:MAG TPA: outer membrane beta-barrel protein [Candidatus Aquilonibacter sp.]|nr:outer membrane beta-barrel protein [Candidatus Aquilonibacter sp.]